MTLKSDGQCVEDLGRGQIPLVNSSVHCCHQSWVIAMEAGKTLFLLLMTYLWNINGFLIIYPLYIFEEKATYSGIFHSRFSD